MKLLITAATEAEILPLLSYLEENWLQKNPYFYQKEDKKVKILLTGVGSVATAYHLAKELNRDSWDLVLQAGIAGAFSGKMALGSVWKISSEVFADLGAEDHSGFLDLFELKLLKANDFPFQQKKLPACHIAVPVLSDLPQTNGLTVNKVSGQKETVQKWEEKYNAGLESMEGAAFHYICLMEKVNFMQIRSVSNYVEIRDKAKWNIPLAIKKLNEVLISFLEKNNQ